MAEAVAEFSDDLSFGRADVYGRFFLVFRDPLAIAVVSTGGLEVEMKLVFVGDHVIHFLHVVRYFGKVGAVLEAILYGAGVLKCGFLYGYVLSIGFDFWGEEA